MKMILNRDIKYCVLDPKSSDLTMIRQLQVELVYVAKYSEELW